MFEYHDNIVILCMNKVRYIALFQKKKTTILRSLLNNVMLDDKEFLNYEMRKMR